MFPRTPNPTIVIIISIIVITTIVIVIITIVTTMIIIIVIITIDTTMITIGTLQYTGRALDRGVCPGRRLHQGLGNQSWRHNDFPRRAGLGL